MAGRSRPRAGRRDLPRPGPPRWNPAGVRWKEALRRANDRCEAVICLLSDNWDASHECKVSTATPKTSTSRSSSPAWSRSLARTSQASGNAATCSASGRRRRFGGRRPRPVEFLTEGLLRLATDCARRASARTLSLAAAGEPDRAPYRGWQPLHEVDAAVSSAVTSRSAGR